jgi:hypothetical protein
MEQAKGKAGTFITAIAIATVSTIIAMVIFSKFIAPKLNQSETQTTK